MGKQKSFEPNVAARDAMMQFWAHGYYATSIDQLVTVTGISRHGLYDSFQSKHGVFEAAVRQYFDLVVTPAFARVEAEDANLESIRGYLYFQIALAEKAGLPGPGCLIGNTMVEAGPHDVEFQQLIAEHVARLQHGFAHALGNEKKARALRRTAIEPLASYLVISTQGLWAISRVEPSAARLRAYCDELILHMNERLQ
jgi:TetR/AcrR family transcriptional regulator, transcriptional repressor for nem operon